MSRSHPNAHAELPELWLVSDARNDSVLEASLAGLTGRAGFIYRHYHLDPDSRRDRFEALSRLARNCGHLVVLSGSPRQAKRWGADGVYGPPDAIAHGPAMLRLGTAHSPREIGAAVRARADAVLLAPVFPTRSHPGAGTLGTLRFLLMARQAPVPVVALGGMDRLRADRMRWPRWAAIDGLSAGYPLPDA